MTGYLCEASHDLAKGPTQANGLESCLFLGISPGFVGGGGGGGGGKEEDPTEMISVTDVRVM